MQTTWKISHWSCYTLEHGCLPVVGQIRGFSQLLIFRVFSRCQGAPSFGLQAHHGLISNPRGEFGPVIVLGVIEGLTPRRRKPTRGVGG